MQPYYDHAGCTIYLGDCREILPELEPVNLVLTDPPYGVDLIYGDGTDDSWPAWVERMDVVMPMMLKAAPIVMASTSKIEGEGYFHTHAPTWRICWHKGAGAARTPIGFKDWETVFVWGPAGPCHDHFRVKTEHRFRSHHPCPKPKAWASWLLRKAAPKAHTILDPFMGSGTTLRAAKDLGRKAIGIEIEERYCEIAAKRLRARSPTVQVGGRRPAAPHDARRRRASPHNGTPALFA